MRRPEGTARWSAPLKIPQHCFREYDIRGVADVDLRDDVVEAIGRTLPSMLAPPKNRPSLIAVARDGRPSSARITSALTEGLLAAGADVIDVGVGPTPLLYFAAHHHATDCGVMVTASHNPAPDNGLKVVRGTASFFGADIAALAKRLVDDELGPVAARRGTRTEADVSAAYVEAVRAASRLPAPDACAAVRFVVDGGNGSAGPLGLQTLRALGFSPDPLFCDIDGTFPNHHPDPTVPKNLESLRERVLATKATVGIAWDGDGDRIGVLDETGEPVWGDKLLLLFARGLLRERPGSAILGEVKCSQTLYADIEARGGKPVVWKTGHSVIKTKMKQDGVLLGGEMSGHMFFADRWFGFDDATYAAVRLLEILVSTKKTLRELLADVPPTFATPEIRVDCPDATKFQVVRRVQDHYRGLHPVLDIDGARIDFGEGAWGLCRASNTGPVLVLRFEARTEARRDEIRREVEAVVADAVRACATGAP